MRLRANGKRASFLVIMLGCKRLHSRTKPCAPDRQRNSPAIQKFQGIPLPERQETEKAQASVDGRIGEVRSCAVSSAADACRMNHSCVTSALHG